MSLFERKKQQLKRLLGAMGAGNHPATLPTNPSERMFSTSPEERARDRVPRPARRVPVILVSGTAKLGLEVHRHLTDAEPGKNLVVSPVSLQLALAMAATGARGETREELARALGADKIAAEDWQACYANMLQALRYGAQDQDLRLANSAWITNGYHLLPEFAENVTGSFGGEAKSLGGADPAADVNAWVAEQTNGKITHLFDKLSNEQRLMLISCVYFKGLWANPFEECDTKPRTFHAPGGDMQRPFMHIRGQFQYGEEKDVQSISLRYGAQGGLACLIVLPSRTLGLRELMRRLGPDFWHSIRNSGEFRQGSLALPRFKVERSIPLNESLQAAGISRAFDPKESDFSGMICEADPVWIEQAQQNTFLEVNEKGTEAAAASWLDMPCGAAENPPPPPPPFEMVVDRPFFCAIGDVASGLVLFTASVWEV